MASKVTSKEQPPASDAVNELEPMLPFVAPESEPQTQAQPVEQTQVSEETAGLEPEMKYFAVRVAFRGMHMQIQQNFERDIPAEFLTASKPAKIPFSLGDIQPAAQASDGDCLVAYFSTKDLLNGMSSKQ
jgi:hypothetical protein